MSLTSPFYCKLRTHCSASSMSATATTLKLDNTSALLEFDEFQTSPKMNESIQFLKSQLNLPSDADLSATDAGSAFSACAYVQ